MSKRGWKASFRFSIRSWGRGRPADNGSGRSSTATTVRRWLVGSVFILITVPGAMELGGEPWFERVAQYLGFETEHAVATELGERHELLLVGGTRAVLNTETAVTTRESSSHQTIGLQRGELLIDTADKPVKHLSVAIGPVRIEATQAKFLVRRDGSSESTVHVLAGEVMLYSAGLGTRGASIAVARLESGTVATIRPGHVTIRRFDLQTTRRLLAWIDGKLIFDGDALRDVIMEFNRYNRDKIQIADDAIAAFRIGGSYSATDPQGFAKQLKVFGIGAQTFRSGGSGASVVVLSKLKSAVKSKQAPPARGLNPRSWPAKAPSATLSL